MKTLSLIFLLALVSCGKYDGDPSVKDPINAAITAGPWTNTNTQGVRTDVTINPSNIHVDTTTNGTTVSKVYQTALYSSTGRLVTTDRGAEVWGFTYYDYLNQLTICVPDYDAPYQQSKCSSFTR